MESTFMDNMLRELAGKRNMILKLRGNRRIFGPPKSLGGPPPPRGSEVFIGGLPRNCHELEIIPVLEQIGTIFQLRLMMESDGRNKGYCYAQYWKPDIAEKAILKLHNYEIRQGYRIRVEKSIDKRIVFVKNILKNKDMNSILRELYRIANGVVKVEVPNPKTKTRLNRGFIFVEFESHRSATDFLRKVDYEGLFMWEQKISAEWAMSFPEANAIHVYNLSMQTSEEALKEIFNKVSDNGVVRVEKRLTSAKVVFCSQLQAEKAKTAMDKKKFNGFRVNIKLNSKMSIEMMGNSPASSLNDTTYGRSSELVFNNMNYVEGAEAMAQSIQVGNGCNSEMMVQSQVADWKTVPPTFSSSISSEDVPCFLPSTKLEPVGTMILPQPMLFINNGEGRNGFFIPMPMMFVSVPFAGEPQPEI